MDSKLLPISGLWINKSKDGNTYMSGKLGPRTNILVFKNKSKREGSNDPDYQMYFAPVEQKESKPAPEAEEDLPF